MAAGCALAVTVQSFWLLIAARLMAGFYSASGALERFGGAELIVPAFKERTLSLVPTGNISEGGIGLNLAGVSAAG